jgi:hypothetical protein
VEWLVVEQELQRTSRFASGFVRMQELNDPRENPSQAAGGFSDVV